MCLGLFDTPPTGRPDPVGAAGPFGGGVAEAVIDRTAWMLRCAAGRRDVAPPANRPAPRRAGRPGRPATAGTPSGCFGPSPAAIPASTPGRNPPGREVFVVHTTVRGGTM